MVDSHLFQNTFPVSTLPKTYIMLSCLSSLYPLCPVKHHNYSFLGTTFWFTRWSYVQFFPSHGVALGGKSSCLHSPQPVIRRCESKHYIWSFPCCQSTLDSFFFVPLGNLEQNLRCFSVAAKRDDTISDLKMLRPELLLNFQTGSNSCISKLVLPFPLIEIFSC